MAQIIPLYKKIEYKFHNQLSTNFSTANVIKYNERAIFNQLYSYFDDNILLSEQQYGCRSNHSAELAVIKLVDYIKYSI